MREIRIKNLNVQNLVHSIIGLRTTKMLLVGKETFEKIKKEATIWTEMKMNFITRYGEHSIETVIEFKKFCYQFYRIERVIVSDLVLYGYSECRGSREQFVIEAE